MAQTLKVIGSDGIAMSVSMLMIIKLKVQSNDVVLVHVHELCHKGLQKLTLLWLKKTCNIKVK